MTPVKKDGSDLFSTGNTRNLEPLAERMRPRTLDEFIGQDHIVGPGRLLRRAIQADRLSSIILAGPPGTGKTTLARIIANSTKSDFNALNAVLAGVADIREAIKRASEQRDLFGRKTILFVDEVHRWNKAQQDALLPWVENGTIRLIGATTENPWFEVNAALVSRSRIFMLRPLDKSDLHAVALQALEDKARGYGKFQVILDEDALVHLVDTCGGDARTLLNALELAVETTPETFPPPDGSTIHISREVAEESIQKKVVLYDKEGDYHFDTISAFIKSIRGSDPDAALYWLARMINGGEDPRFVFRRLLVSASEDIGLGDPQALVVVQSAASAFERVGMPEGQYFLAQATLYLAVAPKSNSTMGYFDALAMQKAETDPSPDVPVHLRDASRDKDGLGHGKGYLYPHAYRDHWVAQNYLPRAIREHVFYSPTDLGWEAAVASETRKRKWQQLALAADTGNENLSAAKADKTMEAFIRRNRATSEPGALELAEAMLALLAPARHSRMSLAGMSSLFALPLSLRACPEGLSTMLTSKEECQGLATWLETYLPPAELRTWQVASQDDPASPAEFGLAWNLEDALQFLARHPASRAPWVVKFSEHAAGTRPSQILEEGDTRAALVKAEQAWLGEAPVNPLESAFMPATLRQVLEHGSLGLARAELRILGKSLTLESGRIERWCNKDGQYWKQVLQTLEPTQQEEAVARWRGLAGSVRSWEQGWWILILENKTGPVTLPY